MLLRCDAQFAAIDNICDVTNKTKKTLNCWLERMFYKGECMSVVQFEDSA